VLCVIALLLGRKPPVSSEEAGTSLEALEKKKYLLLLLEIKL
jgi:hypothetical protein